MLLNPSRPSPSRVCEEEGKGRFRCHCWRVERDANAFVVRCVSEALTPPGWDLQVMQLIPWKREAIHLHCVLRNGAQ